MKKTFYYVVSVLALSVGLFSCSTGDVSLDGNLSGTISNYHSGLFDAINGYDGSTTTVIGTATPGSDGKFSMKLSLPTLSTMGTAPTGVTVSDVNVQGGTMIHMQISLSGTYKGELIKCNDTFTGSSDVSGQKVVTFMYLDRACTIKGTYSESGMTLHYDLNMKKGWNELMVTYISSTEQNASTTLSSDLKWKTFTGSSMSIKRPKLSGIVLR